MISDDVSGNGSQNRASEMDRRGAWVLLAHPYVINEFCPGAFSVNAQTGGIRLDVLRVVREMFQGQEELIAFAEEYQPGWYIASDYRPGGGDPGEYKITLGNALHLVRERLPVELTSLSWFPDARALITPDSVCKPDLGQVKFAYFFMIRFTPSRANVISK